MSLDNVTVHYNSAQPAQLNALAYAEGGDIHVGPGQEKHLPHEAWHVVQQAQGRVKATMQRMNGVPLNDDQGLEHEADVMGSRALAYSARLRGPLQAPRPARRGSEPARGLARLHPLAAGQAGWPVQRVIARTVWDTKIDPMITKAVWALVAEGQTGFAAENDVRPIARRFMAGPLKFSVLGGGRRWNNIDIHRLYNQPPIIVDAGKSGFHHLIVLRSKLLNDRLMRSELFLTLTADPVALLWLARMHQPVGQSQLFGCSSPRTQNTFLPLDPALLLRSGSRSHRRPQT